VLPLVMPRPSLWLALVVATGAIAHADTGAPPVKLTLSPDPAKPVQADPRSGGTPRPVIDAEQVLSLEGLGGTIRAEQEQILAQLIADTSDAHADEKSDYLFRLGELYAKMYRHWRSQSAELARRADQARNAQARQEAAAAAEKAKQALQKAVKTFRALTETDTFRNYPKLDTALFYYGYTLYAAQLAPEARQVFDKLLKNHPNSKYVPEAHLVFGEYFFEKRQLADAEPRYKMVLKFPKSPVYWYAMYKVGWIQMELGRYQEALEAFFQVAQATKNDQTREGLRLAALRDFTRPYAEIGKVDKAYAAFQRVDATRAVEMLQYLAEIYLEQGKGDRAIFVYQELLKLTPGDPSACLWQYNLARATMFGARTPQTVEVCAQDAAALADWARANGATALGQRRPRP
jgi:TolA-binding protein